jgi:glycosyltransferase involved in cell wall biosynthesis
LSAVDKPSVRDHVAQILWLSDAGCATGFGTVTHHIGERLVRDYGHDIHVLAVNHRGDYYPSILEPEKQTYLKLYNPTQLSAGDTYGTSRITEMLGRLIEGPGGDLDCVVVLNDPNILLDILYENPYDKEKYLLRSRPILYYVPVDGTNLPPVWTELIPKITNVVAMSKWGQGFFEGSKLVYHGVDPSHYWSVKDRPIELSNGQLCRTKRECKRAFGMEEDSFVIGRIDSNSGRKDFPAFLRAIMPLMRKHKDIELFMHTQTVQMQHGINIPVMLGRWPDVDAKRIHTPGLYSRYSGWPTQDMNGLINAFDIFVSTSRGEGFGLSLAQSIACGVPVVAQNVSAIPEVVGPGGVLIEPLERLITVPAGQDMWLADIDAFSREIEHLYEARGVIRKLGEAGKEHARSLSWDVAAAKFDAYITGLSQAASPVQEVEIHG